MAGAVNARMHLVGGAFRPAKSTRSDDIWDQGKGTGVKEGHAVKESASSAGLTVIGASTFHEKQFVRQKHPLRELAPLRTILDPIPGPNIRNRSQSHHPFVIGRLIWRR